MNKFAKITVFLLSEFVFGLWPIARYGLPDEAVARGAIFIVPWLWWYGHRKNVPLISLMLVPTLWLIGVAHLLVDGLSGLDVLLATITMSAYVLTMMLGTHHTHESRTDADPVIWKPTESLDETVQMNGRIMVSVVVLVLCLAPLYAIDLLLTDDVLHIWSHQAHRVQACTILLLSLQGAYAVDTLLDTHLSSPQRHRKSWFLVTVFCLILGVTWTV
ncbi:MAG: hypothetical protein CMH52_09220 [Myxococcales bacterium]|nr:hypothetical protein [Myxococcales bacterium]|tara:strand:- start:1372 stop:2022 length:651 start_codon:yes stop_codon:yes gene_type:complete